MTISSVRPHQRRKYRLNTTTESLSRFLVVDDDEDYFAACPKCEWFGGPYYDTEHGVKALRRHIKQVHL